MIQAEKKGYSLSKQGRRPPRKHALTLPSKAAPTTSSGAIRQSGLPCQTSLGTKQHKQRNNLADLTTPGGLPSKPGPFAELCLLLSFAQNNRSRNPSDINYIAQRSVLERGQYKLHTTGQAPAIHIETRLMFSVCCTVAEATSSVLKEIRACSHRTLSRQAFIYHYKAGTSEQSSPFPSLAKWHERSSRD